MIPRLGGAERRVRAPRGFALMACMALHGTGDEADFLEGLRLIEACATDERNFVKKGVNWALQGHRREAKPDLAGRGAGDGRAVGGVLGQHGTLERQGCVEGLGEGRQGERDMTTEPVAEGAPPTRRLGRSALAVVGGLVAIFAASMAMDELMWTLGVFPRPPAITYETAPYLIATVYRAAIGVLGCWIAGRLAQQADGSRLGPRRDRRPDQPGRNCRLADDRDGTDLVPDRARPRDHALRLAGRPTGGGTALIKIYNFAGGVRGLRVGWQCEEMGLDWQAGRSSAIRRRPNTGPSIRRARCRSSRTRAGRPWASQWA